MPEAHHDDDVGNWKPKSEFTSKYYYPIHRANLVRRDFDNTVERFKHNTTLSARNSDIDPFNTFSSKSSRPTHVSPHRKPVTKTYNYNYDVETNYYKPLLDRRRDLKKGRASSPLGSQTYAERCVKYWPGMTSTRSWSNENSRRHQSSHSYDTHAHPYRGANDRPILECERNFPGNVLKDYDAYVAPNKTISSDHDLEYLTRKFRNL